MSEQDNSKNYKFGHELRALLKISRRNGFRFVYAYDQEKKNKFALDLVQELSKSVNLPYHKEVVDDLILNVKDYEEVKLLQ